MTFVRLGENQKILIFDWHGSYVISYYHVHVGPHIIYATSVKIVKHYK